MPQQKTKMFQTVNPKLKHKGIFGGHLNIRNIVSKTEQPEQLLSDSNLDYLCLIKTWLISTTPSGVFGIPGCRVHRQDRKHSKGGGVMICVKEGIQCKQTDLPNDTLECVGVIITLSPEMSFI